MTMPTTLGKDITSMFTRKVLAFQNILLDAR